MTSKDVSGKVRYGIVGAGWIAQEAFMPGVRQTDNSILTALVTGDLEKARTLGHHYEIEHCYGYENYDRMLADGVVDAVYLALPNTLHRDYAVRAAQAGVHVLVEKPMAPTVADCEAIIAAAKAADVKLMIAYRLHFEPATLEALEVVRRGEIGDPRLFSSVFAQQVRAANHRTKAGLWAGPLPDMGCYPLNAVRHLFSAEPIEVVALAGRGSDERFEEVDEAVSVVLRFPDDRIATFTVSFGAADIDEYRVVGTNGDLQVQPGFLFGCSLGFRLTIGGKTEERRLPETDQFGAEAAYFSECILTDRAPEPDGEEGLADVRVLLAIEDAIRSGQPQHVPETARPRHPTMDQLRLVTPARNKQLVKVATPGG
jgi:predicted dehydrogenase